MINTVFKTKRAIIGLCNRELGTYFLRKYNDKKQKWHLTNKDFGLNMKNTYAGKRGLGVLNMYAVIDEPYLYKYALSYYTACLADSFLEKDLIKHITQFSVNKYHAKKLVINVLKNKNMIKYAFEGCIKILRNLDKIDFDTYTLDASP